MLRRSVLALVALTTLAGCESATITEVYMSRDSSGIRRTKCIHPEGLGLYAFVEGFSAREDTLIWPVFTVVEEVDPIATSLFALRADGQPTYKDREVDEFRNWAPGKGNFTLSIGAERDLDADPPDPPFPRGTYRWDFFVNDESTARDGFEWVVNPECDYSPLPETQQ